MVLWHLRSDGPCYSRFRQRFSNKGSSNTPTKFNIGRVPNPKTQGGICNGYSLSNCAKCGRNNEGKCLAGMDSRYDCGKSRHNIRDFQMIISMGREGWKLLLVVQVKSLQSKIDFTHFRLVMSKKVLLMLLPVCWKSSKFMFWSRCNLSFLMPFVAWGLIFSRMCCCLFLFLLQLVILLWLREFIKKVPSPCPVRSEMLNV